MTRLYTIFLVLFVLVSAISFQGCEGPEGPTGPNGPAGSQGPKGDPGDPGTANVIYSEWNSVTTNMWQRTTGGGLVRFRHDIAAPPIDQAVLDRGMVLVYVRLSQDDNQVRSLPYTVESNLTAVNLDYSLLDKTVRLWSKDPDQGRNLTPPDGQYRYIIVPGGQQGRIAGKPLSYEEAAAIFNLPD